MPRPRKGAPSRDGAKLRADVIDELWATHGSIVDAVPWVREMFEKLEGGEAVEVHRWDLPDWCPDRHVGRPDNRIMLHSDNSLSLVG